MTTQIKAGVIAANAVNSSELASGALSGQNFTGDVIFSGTTQGTRLGLGVAPHATAGLNITTTNQHIRLNNGSELGVISVLSGGELDIWGNGDGESINFRTGSGAGTVVMNVVGNKVGIGITSNINANLHVGSSNATGDATNPAIQIGGSSSGNTYRLGLYTSTEGGVIENKNGDDGLQFRVKTAGEVLRIMPSGNVGIGTTSPSSLLELRKTTAGYTTSGTGNKGSVLTLHHEAQWESAYGTGGSTPDWLGAIDFSTGDGSTGEGIRASIRTTVDSYYNTNSLAFYTADQGDTTLDQRMIIKNDGNVGIGESSPSKLLHLTSNTNYEGILIKGAGHKQLTIESTQSSKQVLTTFTSASQNMSIGLDTDNAFIFHSGTASTERMRIDSSGNLIVGKAAANLTLGGLYVSNNDFMAYTNTSTDTGDRCLILNRQNGTGELVDFRYQNSSVGKITHNGSQTSYGVGSDYRLKENVEYDFTALDRVAQLKPARFNFIADADTTVDGFIAHEVQDIVPEAITGEKDAVDDEGNPVMQGIDHSKLVPLLTKAIQEQQTIIDDLKSRITKLEG